MRRSRCYNCDEIISCACGCDGTLMRHDKWGIERKFILDTHVSRKRKLSEETKKRLSRLKMGNKYNLGKKHSEWTKQKRSLSLKGRKPTKEGIQKMVLTRMGNGSYKHKPETKEKISKANLGKVRSQESKERYRLANLGSKNPRYGKRPSEESIKKLVLYNKNRPRWVIEKVRMANLGKKRSPSARENISKSLRGRKLSLEHIARIRASHPRGEKHHFYGKKRSLEDRKKMSAGLRGKYCGAKHWNYKGTISEEHKQRLREFRRIFILPKKDTKIEVKIQGFLKELNIGFVKHRYVYEIKNGYSCDVFIPSLNMIIECDGDYWHGNPLKYQILNNRQIKQSKLDEIRTRDLIEKGFKVLRVWESDIENMDVNEFRDRLGFIGMRI